MSARDSLGNPISDSAAVAAVNDFTAGFLAYETSASDIVKAAAAAPDSALLNAYAGALFMLMESPRAAGRARSFLAKAQAASGANAREAATIGFVEAWVADDIPAARARSAQIVEAWPTDMVMLKLNQYLGFNAGDAPDMLRVASKAAPSNDGIPQMHGMMAFALEQCHLLNDAEAAARRALELTDREPWAQHALAHVMITQGRIDEGARFMEGAAGTWTGLNSFMSGHNWWHLALFYLSQGRDDAVLAAYDSQVWAGDRDYSQDQIGAVSLLARLELAGVDVGDRWGDVGEHLAARGPDAELPFLSVQYLYGLARAGRPEAGALLEAMRRRAAEAPAHSRAVWAEVALPLAEGIAAFLREDHAAAASLIERALPRLGELGGSHAQRDLFEQIWLAAVMASGRWSRAQQALEVRRAMDPDGVPVNRALARAYQALDLPVQAAQAQARAERTARRWAA